MKEEHFLAQSYDDAWNDYIYSLENEKAKVWDYVVVTSSNEKQADSYRIQIDKRIKENRLPKGTRFVVVSDLDGKRVGSGGATLNVLKEVSGLCENGKVEEKKILVIHSGGDSKRIPQYSACGKLFTPIPRIMPNGFRATIFDELIIAVSGIPARVNAGMLVMPSDTEILYNPLQIDLSSCDAAGLSIKAGIREGMEHGVFVQGKGGNIDYFMHKQSEEKLRSFGAVDDNGCVDIDTGCIWIGSRVVTALLRLICSNNKIDMEKLGKFVNPKVCISFYADFIYPLAEKSTCEQYYREIPEGVMSEELLECRREIWDALSPFSIKLIRLMPARYIHFGMTHEMYALNVKDISKYAYLGWKRQNSNNIDTVSCCAVNNGYISPDAEVSDNCYVEDSIIDGKCKVGGGSILSGIRIGSCCHIPGNIVLHGLKLNNGKYVCRIYGMEDNPKNSMNGEFLGSSISEIIKYTGIAAEDIWDGTPASIWNAKLYSECDSIEEAVKSALGLYEIAVKKADDKETESWKKSKRYSLNSSFNCAAAEDIIKWQDYVEKYVRISNFLYLLGHDTQKNALKCLKRSGNLREESDAVYDNAGKYEFPMNVRIYLALSQLAKENNITVKGHNAIQLEDMAYKIISDGIVAAVKDKHKFNYERFCFAGDEEAVELPVRVNFCGSPSDAAPYCLEHGGTMFDGALSLKGELPVKAVVKRLNEHVIIFESFDLQAKEVIYDLQDIRNCGDPYDTFALHKAVLAASGVVPLNMENVTMDSICSKIGGGIYLSTFVDVPKGSGLGTSSILAAACLKAVNRIFNQDISNDCIYAQVFAAEQLMTTGGGWQDQAGGLTYGLKLMKTRPGMYQKIDMDYVSLKKEVFEELNERFALIFSGQRRLARNVLREETNRCIRNDSDAIKFIERIREICVLMKYQLERGNITAFAGYVTEQFELVKKLDKGASNTCIEYIFDVCSDLIDGKAICGAGGGGFLQVILKKGVTKQMLTDRINKEFLGCGVEVWDCKLI